MGRRPRDVADLTWQQAFFAAYPASVETADDDAPPEPAGVRVVPATFVAECRDKAFRAAASLAGLTPRKFAALDGPTAAGWLAKVKGEQYPPEKVVPVLAEWAKTLPAE